MSLALGGLLVALLLGGGGGVPAAAGGVPSGGGVPGGDGVPSGAVPAFLRPPMLAPESASPPAEAPAPDQASPPAELRAPELDAPPAVLGGLGTGGAGRAPESGKVMSLLGIGLPWMTSEGPRLGLHLNGELWLQLVDFLWMNVGAGFQLGNELTDTNACMDADYCGTGVMAVRFVFGPLSSRFEVGDTIFLVSLAELHIPVLFGHDTTDEEFTPPSYDEYYSSDTVGLGLGFRAAVLPWKLGDDSYAGFRTGFVPFFFGIASQILTVEFIATF